MNLPVDDELIAFLDGNGIDGNERFFLHDIIQNTIFPDAQLPIRNRGRPQRLAIARFGQGVVAELLYDGCEYDFAIIS